MTVGSPHTLDAAARARLRAVVLDTNAFGHGMPDLGQLRVVAAQMAGADIETWVPEPIAWEWAEHLATAVEAYRGAERTAFKQMKRGGLAPEPCTLPTSSRVETTDVFLQKLADVPHVTLLPLSGEAARAGLRDQVMQTGPGRRKSDIKTGASDSAWLRDVLATAGGTFDSTLLVTQDRGDIYRACEALGVAAPVMATLRDLPQMVLGFVADPGHLSKLITQYFTSLLAELREFARDGVPAADHPDLDLGILELDTALLDEYRWPDTQIHDVSISHLNELVSVDDVAVDGEAATSASPGAAQRPTSGTAEATVEFLADLDVWTYEIDRDGEVRMDGQNVYDARVICPVLVRVENGLVRFISPLGGTRACPPK